MRNLIADAGTCLLVACMAAAIALMVKSLIDSNRPSNGLEPKYPCLVQKEPGKASWVLCSKVKYGSKLYYSMEESV